MKLIHMVMMASAMVLIESLPLGDKPLVNTPTGDMTEKHLPALSQQHTIVTGSNNLDSEPENHQTKREGDTGISIYKRVKRWNAGFMAWSLLDKSAEESARPTYRTYGKWSYEFGGGVWGRKKRSVEQFKYDFEFV